MEAVYSETNRDDKEQAIYNLFTAYLHTVPLEQLLQSVERARRDAQLRYIVIHGAACSYCLGRAKRLEGSYLRTFAFELKEQLAQTLAAFVKSILAGPHRCPDVKEAARELLEEQWQKVTSAKLPEAASEPLASTRRLG